MDHVALAIAVVVDREVVIVLRQELRLAKFARPRADHFVGAKIAALDDFHRRFQFFAEQLATAAIPGESQQRTQHWQVAHADAEVAFQRPEAGDDGARHAVLFFGAIKKGFVFL